MAANSVRVVDKGWRRIHRELQSLHGASTKVGFHKGVKHDKTTKRSSSKASKGKASAAGKEVPDIATVAAWNIFGTTNKAGKAVVPRRDFMGQAIEVYQEDLLQFKAKLLDKIYAGQLTAPQALALLGQRHEDQVKRIITTGDFVPNAPATIAAKGSDRPLINQGQMRQNVRHAEEFKRGAAKYSLTDSIGAGLDKLGGGLVPGEGGE